MKKISNTSKILLAISSLLLLIAIFLPIWRIDLWAPQYPEGLSMYIWLNKLSGDVATISGLNHYIGMARIEENMFPEFKFLVYIVVFFAIVAAIGAISGSRKWLWAFVILLVLGGIGGLADFYNWSYNYGHNLDPHAPIKVPGMTYQPPLLGYKALLNFGAYSIPAIGGWLFLGAGILSIGALVCEYFICNKIEKTKINPTGFMHGVAAGFTLFSTVLFSACGAEGPRPIVLGKDACAYCKMAIMDERFVCELISDKGKLYVFDDLRCLVAYHKEHSNLGASSIYVANFLNPKEWVRPETAHFIYSEQLRSPMQGNVAALGHAKETLALPATWDILAKDWAGIVNTVYK